MTDQYADGNAIIEEVHEHQREMALAIVRAVGGMSNSVANDPVSAAMNLAEQVLREQPPPPGLERREWLSALLEKIHRIE